MSYADLISEDRLQIDKIDTVKPVVGDFDVSELPDQTPLAQTNYDIYDLVRNEEYPEMSFYDKTKSFLNKEKHFIPEVGKSLLQKGTMGVAETIGQLIYAVGDSLSPNEDQIEFMKDNYSPMAHPQFEIAKFVKQIGVDTKDFWKDKKNKVPQNELVFKGEFLDNPSFTRGFSIAAESFPLMGGAFLAGMTTKSPQLAYAIMGGATGAQTYEEARDKGKSQNRAFTTGVLAGTGEAVIERYLGVFDKLFIKSGVKEGAEGVAKEVGKKTFAGFAKEFTLGAMAEGGTEALQTLSTNMVRKFGIDKTIQLQEGLIESIVAGALSGGTMTGVSYLAQNVDTAIDEYKEAGGTQEEIDQFVELSAEAIAVNKKAVEPVITKAYEEAIAPKEEVEQAPVKEIDPLEQEALKYDTAEELVDAKINESDMIQAEIQTLEKKKTLPLSEYSKLTKLQNEYGRQASQLGKLTDIYNKAHAEKVVEPKKKVSSQAKKQAKSLSTKYGVDIDNLSKYEGVTNEGEVSKALAEWDINPDKALNVALGYEQAPDGITPSAFYVVAEQIATKNGDVEMLSQLAQQNPMVEQTSKAGQFIQMLNQIEPNSPLNSIKKISQDRKAEYKKIKKQDSDIVIKKETKKLKKTVEEQFADMDNDIDDFIKEMEC